MKFLYEKKNGKKISYSQTKMLRQENHRKIKRLRTKKEIKFEILVLPRMGINHSCLREGIYCSFSIEPSN